jgi:hypothetical protein
MSRLARLGPALSWQTFPEVVIINLVFAYALESGEA